MGSEEGLTSRLQLEEMIAAQRRAEISAQRNAILHGMELKFAELVGTDGGGGQFAALQREVEEMKREITTLTLFRHRVLWTIGGFSAIGAFVASLIMIVVQRYLK